MDVNTKPTETINNPGTFGGEAIDTLHAEISKVPAPGPNVPAIDLATPKEEEQPSLSISGQGDPLPLRLDAIDRKKEKIAFAFGDKAPDPAIVEQYFLQNDEKGLRQTLADQKNADDHKTRIDLVREKASQPLTDESSRMLESLAKWKPDANPDTVIEAAYANEYVKTLYGMKEPEQNIAVQAQQEDPKHAEYVDDTARLLATKQEAFKTLEEEARAGWEDRSFGGKALDFGVSMIPFDSAYTNYLIGTALPDLKVKTMSEAILWIAQQPPEDMMKYGRQVITVLKEHNQLAAMQFADSLSSFTTGDALINNVMTIADLPVAGALIKAPAKIVAAGTASVARSATKASVAESRNVLVTALKDHLVSNGHTEASVNSILSKGGDLDQAAAAVVTAKAREILEGKVDINMTPREIREVLPSVFNPEALIADGANFGGQKSLELMAHMIQNSANTLNAINESVKVGRLPEEALQVAIKEAQEALKNRFKTVDSTVVDMHHNPRNYEFAGDMELFPAKRLPEYADDLVDANGHTFESLREGAGYAPEAPQPWYKEVETFGQELAQNLGLAFSPKVWFGNVKDGSYGLAFQEGHIVLSNKLSQGQAMTILGHELGHHHQWHLFDVAEPEVRTAIVKEWVAHRRSLRKPDLTEKEIMHFVGGADRGVDYKSSWARYGNGFKEWYAEQVSKFLTTNSQPLSISERFFKGIADHWKSIYAKITGLKPVGREVEAFIRKNWKGGELGPSQHPSARTGPVEFLTTRPEQTQTNVGSVTALLGNRDGSSFDNAAQAHMYARDIYGLNKKEYDVRQKGVGFYIGVTKDLDETTPGVRDALITTQNKTPSHLGHIIGWLKGGGGKVSEYQQQQRIAAISGQQNLVAALKDLGKDITSLNKKEKAGLEKVMRDNHLTVRDAETGATGIFHRSEKDLIENYQRLNGRPPSDREIKAYFSAVQINDLEYLMRNNSYYKELSRLGLEKFSLNTSTTDPITGVKGAGKTKEFYGKLIDDLPLSQADAKHPGLVGIYEEGKDPVVVNLNQIPKSEVERLKQQGFQIIQTGVPNRNPAGELFGEEPVNFILTKSHNNRRLEKYQLEYNPGFHQEYPHSFFVKQPIVRRVLNEDGSVKHHVYEGDTTAMGFHTQAEADKFSKRFNEARQLLKEKKFGELKTYLDNNLPYTVRQFRDLFEKKIPGTEKTRYNIDDDFFSVSKSTSIVDVHGQRLQSTYTDLNDTLRSPWNLYNQVDKKFVGQRDPILHTVKESGTEANPVFQLENAETIDPFSSLQRGMQNMVRNQYMLDYRTQAVESWIEEFKHLIDADEMEIRADPLKYLYNDHFLPAKVENRNDIIRAKLSQAAIREFLGTSMADVDGVDAYKHLLLNKIYENLGQKYSDWAAPTVLAAETNPFKIMRGFAFHTQIGLFNPFHWWQNAMTMGNALAIAGPKAGFEGAKAGIVFGFLRLNDSDAALANLAKGIGWKKEELAEAWKSFKKSGRMYVEGEHAWKDDFSSPKFFQGKFGSFLDKGQIFFKEGEKTARAVAYAVAFREWRLANPTAELTADVARAILKRSDDMTVNMTRASAASWQQGVFSVPFQFMSFNARLTEQMLSGLIFNKGALNRKEAARLMAFNSAIYGVPMGISTTIGAFYDPYEEIREYVQEHYGWGLNDTAVTAMHDGILGLATSMVTGRPNTISSKTGPSGSSFFKDVFTGEKSFWEVALGVGGSKVGEAITTAQPLVKSLLAAAQGSPETHPLMASDITDLLNTVQSFSMTTKLYLALTTGKQMSKHGRYEGDVNPTEALFQFVTKGEPWDISDAKLLSVMTKDRSTAIKEISKQIIKEHGLAMTALESGDEKTYDSRMRRVEALFAGADMSTDEKATALKTLWDENRSLIERVPYEWAYKHAPASMRPQLQEQLGKASGSPP